MRTEVARSECLIDAFVLDGVLHDTHSSLVKERHRLYKPVKEFKARNCTSLINQTELDGEEWVHGSYVWAIHHVYDSCPGSLIDHDCCKEVTRDRVPISIAS